MGLIYETSKWLDKLWSEHIQLSASARDVITEGVKRQGHDFAGFSSDLHARLYLPNDPATIASVPAWAQQLHAQAGTLAEWQRLRAMCSRNGFAAGIATEALLGQLLPLVPQMPPEEPQGKDSSGDLHVPSGGAGSGQEGPSEADIRAALRRASRGATAAVRQAEGGLEGLASSTGLSMPGSGIQPGGHANLAAIRDAHSRLASSPRLRKIAELAGRLERCAATKRKSKVRPGVGEIHGVDPGSDIARLLPSELVCLRHPKLRLAMLSRLMEQRALCYAMQGREPQQRGPIVVLLDESASMRGQEEIWSKAVCLALLSTASKQNRPWHLIAFQSEIVREVCIPSRATAAQIQQALDVSCGGGTDFSGPVLKAVEIIKSSRTMHQADVVIITDGEDYLTPDAVDKARELTKVNGVSWFVIGIGSSLVAQTLQPIATHMVHISDLSDSDPVIPIINLDRQ